MRAQHASENVPDPTNNNSFYKKFDDLQNRIAY